MNLGSGETPGGTNFSARDLQVSSGLAEVSCFSLLSPGWSVCLGQGTLVESSVLSFKANWEICLSFVFNLI